MILIKNYFKGRGWKPRTCIVKQTSKCLPYLKMAPLFYMSVDGNLCGPHYFLIIVYCSAAVWGSSFMKPIKSHSSLFSFGGTLLLDCNSPRIFWLGYWRACLTLKSKSRLLRQEHVEACLIIIMTPINHLSKKNHRPLKFFLQMFYLSF